MADPFASDGEWLRCALHAHTTNSDGELPPAALVSHYKRAGFDVLAITDHWVRTVEPPVDGLVAVAGVELDATVERTGREAHVLGLGVETDPPREGSRLPTVGETAAWINENGGVAFLAHPYWSGLAPEDVAATDGIAGIEAYNAGCELEVGRGVSTVHWDEALEAGRHLLGLATDDSHHPGFDSSLAWVWARCTERTPGAVVAALRAGAFYGSTGPRIHDIRVEEGAVEVVCSPSARVTLVAGRERGSAVSAGRLGYAYRARALETEDGGLVVRARLDRPPGAPYGRIEVTGADGGKAWTNALWNAA